MISEELKQEIISLAKKYETKDFLKKDPSQFMHKFSNPIDQEIVALLSATMAFGNRIQINKHIELILDDMGTDLSHEWVQKKKYLTFFTKEDISFYRMYTHNDFILFFDTILLMLKKSVTIGQYIKEKICLNSSNCTPICIQICNLFPENCHLIPHSKTTAAKRINMFLRWMVRDNSPVDLGLWASWIDKKDLLMPLDTHVMQQSTKFSLIKPSSSGKVRSATLKTAIELTETMKEIFPSDPLKADFALFSLGVNK
jgi:uncharacterized protein (TIGR02757 family)